MGGRTFLTFSQGVYAKYLLKRPSNLYVNGLHMGSRGQFSANKLSNWNLCISDGIQDFV